MKLNKFTIIFILVLAFLIRFWAIGSTPSLNPDEAAIGYDAYSLLMTGKDEHGVSWPVHFKSFGDFKPGGYFYLALPFVKFLGLNPLSVRLPNLILSICTIFFLYLIILLLTKNLSLSLLSALILSVCPWHIHFSRGSWESSAALSFITIGIYFFLKSIYKTKNFFLNFFLFVFFFVLSLYTYHAARIVGPLISLSLFIIYFPQIKKKSFKSIIISLIIGIIITAPVAVSFLKNGGTARFGGVGLTADQGPVNRANELINQHGNTKLINRIIHNKRLLYAISWGEKYCSHFDFNYLFISGDEVPRSKVPEMGQFYIFEIIFLIIGIISLLRSTIYDLRSKIFILSWLFITPLASSLTFQAPSALRSLPMVIPLCILISLGLYTFLQKMPKFIGYLLIIIYCFSLIYYLDAYFVHYPKRLPTAWSYGFNQIVPYIEKEKINYQNVYVTDKYDQPYILFLFYSKYPPQKIQKEIKLTPPDQFGFSTIRQFNKYHFEKIDWSSIPKNSLVIASDEKIPALPIKIINFPNGQEAFKIYIKL
jgi:4-amino-4-deoxy-L-arabinose transferase-like glycosyltransferase